MPDHRHHRGPHPQDESLFASACWPDLAQATAHVSWLLTRGYAIDSSLKLVGDRFDLDSRQRLAVRRAACSDDARQQRLARQLPPQQLSGEAIDVDGFNLLTTVEAALGGGVLLRCRDGCLRDMASMHGSYRKVAETLPALERIGQTLSQFPPSVCTWWLDAPVSNSGRVSRLILDLSVQRGWPWQTRLVADPDPILSVSDAIVVSADSLILDSCRRWADIASAVIGQLRGTTWIVPLAN